jgi:Domain of unknown function (DUF4260)
MVALLSWPPVQWLSFRPLGGNTRITTMKPGLLLHIEGAAVLLAAGVFYHQLHASWLWFAVLFLTPDLFMLGYLTNKKVGAAVYNLGHTYTVPLLLLSVLWLLWQASYVWISLIWLAHLGFDRMLGYGLKYETAFKDTHFQRV